MAGVGAIHVPRVDNRVTPKIDRTSATVRNLFGSHEEEKRDASMKGTRGRDEGSG